MAPSKIVRGGVAYKLQSVVSILLREEVVPETVTVSVVAELATVSGTA
jgi:hypothetical protein